MTELSFLIELLLHHKLPLTTKELVAKRIKEVEESVERPAVGTKEWFTSPALMPPYHVTSHGLDQIIPTQGLSTPMPPAPLPVPIDRVAQTPAAMNAMNERNLAVSDSIAGKVDKNTGSPKKFRGPL